MALSNVRSRYVMANGVKTHYSESGDDGPVLIALHGGGAAGEEAVDVVALVGCYVLLGARHVQEAVRVGFGECSPLFRCVGVVRAGGDAVSPLGVDDQARKAPQDVHWSRPRV